MLKEKASAFEGIKIITSRVDSKLNRIAVSMYDYYY